MLPVNQNSPTFCFVVIVIVELEKRLGELTLWSVRTTACCWLKKQWPLYQLEEFDGQFWVLLWIFQYHPINWRTWTSAVAKKTLNTPCRTANLAVDFYILGFARWRRRQDGVCLPIIQCFLPSTPQPPRTLPPPLEHPNPQPQTVVFGFLNIKQKKSITTGGEVCESVCWRL